MGIIGPTAPSGAAGGSLSGTYPNPGLANEAVTNAILAAEAVTFGKVKGSAAVSEAAEGIVNTAGAGVARKTVFAFTGNGAKLTWEFNTFFGAGFQASITVFQGKAGEGIKAAEVLFAPVKGMKVKWKSEGVLEITFTEAPAAKEPWFVCIDC